MTISTTHLDGQVLHILGSRPTLFVKILALDNEAATVRYCTAEGVETGTTFTVQRDLLSTDTQVHAEPRRLHSLTH